MKLVSRNGRRGRPLTAVYEFWIAKLERALALSMIDPHPIKSAGAIFGAGTAHTLIHKPPVDEQIN